MGLRTRLADLIGSDPYPAEEPQAAADREREQPRPDYSSPKYVEPEPEEHKWSLNGTHISVSSDHEHADLFDFMGHQDFTRPHAWGKLILMNRWEALWEIESANMGLHLIEKRLKRSGSSAKRFLSGTDITAERCFSSAPNAFTSGAIFM